MTPEQIDYVLSNYLFQIILGIIAIITVLFVIILVQGILISRMRTLYKNIFDKKLTNSIDDVLISNKTSIDSIISESKLITDDIVNIKKRLDSKMSHSAILKYNALENMAGNLSFVYVLLNDNQTGFIMNGIHSNEGHYLYLKEVVNGKSNNLLSKEESETLVKVIKDI
jgi:hypothetical protein